MGKIGLMQNQWCHTVKVFHSKNIGFETIFLTLHYFLRTHKITTHDYLMSQEFQNKSEDKEQHEIIRRWKRTK